MSNTQQYWASAHRRFSGEWAVMTFYERFEQVVALILANVNRSGHRDLPLSADSRALHIAGPGSLPPYASATRGRSN